MTYREMMIEIIKITCQDVIDRVEDLVPDSDGLFDMDMVIHIPALRDTQNGAPTIKINSESYPTKPATDKLMEILRDA